MRIKWDVRNNNGFPSSSVTCISPYYITLPVKKKVHDILQRSKAITELK